MNNNERINYSPENKKINYYEQNPKLFKKQRLRPSLEKKSIINEINDNEFINTNMTKPINIFDDSELRDGFLEMKNNVCVSQPININNNLKNNNNFCNVNILEDFLEELENDEKKANNYIINKNEPMKSELNGLFTKNKYNIYFQTSRTQNSQYNNIWDDFHKKRDKL